MPKGCSSSECGDYSAQVTMAGGAGNITALVSYPRPGRYIVRLQVRSLAWVVAVNHLPCLEKMLSGAVPATSQKST